MEESRERALEQEVERQAQQPMLTKYDWEQHIFLGISPAVKYLFKRFHEGGDRHNLVTFYDGAKIFDPNYAKTVTTVDARKCIDKLGLYPRLAEGNNISKLKKGWKAYKINAQMNISRLDKDDDILSWHYGVFLGLDEEKEIDKNKNTCRYCGNENGCCSCN